MLTIIIKNFLKETLQTKNIDPGKVNIGRKN